MLTIHDYDTPSEYTWKMVISGMRNSWESQEKGDSAYQEDDFVWDVVERFTLGESDKALAMRLVLAGSDHGKFMRQLPVVVDLTAPESWWKQADTYRIGTTRNSTSTMHTLGSKPITAAMFSWEDMHPEYQKNMCIQLEVLRQRWIVSGKRKGPEQNEWRALVNALPMGFNFRSCWSANYQVLRSIYHARKHHRLGEWREMCAWIETLPYAELITVAK